MQVKLICALNRTSTTLSRRIIPLVFACGLCIVSCIRHSSLPASPEQNPTFRWTVQKDASTFDWNLCADPSCLKQVSLFMEGLTGFQSKGNELELVPRLATHWQFLSSNQLVFKLRRDVRWSDGTALTSVHFVNAWKRVLQASEATPYARALFVIDGAREFSKGELAFARVGIRTPDPWTIFIRIKQSHAALPALFAHPVSWPIRYADRDKEAFPVVLGAFLPKNKTPQGQNRYLPNPDYYRGPVRVSELTVTAVADGAERILRFLNGESDLAEGLSTAETNHLRKDPRLSARTEPEFVAILLNARSGMLRSRLHRKRLMAALDLSEMKRIFRWPVQAAAGFFASLQVPDLFVPSGLPYRSPSPSLNLQYGALPDGLSLAENIRMQWQQKLNLRVDIERKAKPDTQLVEIPWDAYRVPRSMNNVRDAISAAGGHVPAVFTGDSSFLTAQQWFQSIQDSGATFLPLFARTSFYLIAPKFSALRPTGVEGWDFSVIGGS